MISPADTVDVTIADTSPSGAGYLLEISYDNGGSWSTVAAAQPIGLTSFDPSTQFPSVVASGQVVFRATNNDTSVSGTSAAVTLVADQVTLQYGAGAGDTDFGIAFIYVSDSAFADHTAGDPLTMNVLADTDGGPEAPTMAVWGDAHTAVWSFADPLTGGGVVALQAAGDVTWDRPAAVFTPPQNANIF